LLDQILDAAPPDARYAVITSARKSRVLVPPWHHRHGGDDDDAALARARASVQIENGSNLTAALARAQGIAADVDTSSDRGADPELARIVVLSDMQLAFAITEPVLTRSFTPADGGIAPLTHVVMIPESADAELPLTWGRSYVDLDPRAAGPESTGGIWVDASGGDDVEPLLAPHLIRPTRIDRPRVTLGGHDMLDGAIVSDIKLSPRDPEDRVQSTGIPTVLFGGSGLRIEAEVPYGAVKELRFQGLLWAQPIVQRVKRDTSLAGLAAVDDVSRTLDDAIVRSIAHENSVVSRVTSLLSLPTWRPLVDVDVYSNLSGCGCGCGCSGCSCCGIGHGTVHPAPLLHEHEMLERLLADDAKACGAKHAEIDVEVGDGEILEVTASKATRCVTERFWSHRLDVLAQQANEPRAFRSHQTFSVAADASPR
jgi:hypothetical protein